MARLLITLLILGLLGCSSTPDKVEQVKTSPALANQALANLGTAITAVLRQHEVLQQMTTVNLPENKAVALEINQQLNREITIATTNVRGSKALAEKELTASGNKDKLIVEMQQDDPFRTAIRWTAWVLTVGGLVVGIVLAVKFKSFDGAMTCGLLASVGICLAVLDRLMPTIYLVVKWGFISSAVLAAILVVWLVWRRVKAQYARVVAETTIKNIVQSIEKAKDEGVLLVGAAAKAIINKIQTEDTKAVVAKIVAAEQVGVKS